MATYCISDIHGNMDIWNKIRSFINLEEDTLICLGDCADRGPEGWEIIKDMLRGVAIGNIIYVRGNHEQMLIDALDDYINYDGMMDYAYMLLAQNGGAETFDLATQDHYMTDWLAHLKRTKPFYEYLNTKEERIFLSHAGCSWNRLKHHFDNGKFKKENIEMQEYLKKELLWNRKNFDDKYYYGYYDYQVFGHTPIPYLVQNEDYFLAHPHSLKSSYDSCKEWHKINIDAGTYATDLAIVLNLDTFEEILIKSR